MIWIWIWEKGLHVVCRGAGVVVGRSGLSDAAGRGLLGQVVVHGVVIGGKGRSTGERRGLVDGVLFVSHLFYLAM